ncbi:MAG: isoprenylcysteine carboxylmethyltransferase family protein [Bacteroidales bacterium]|nr:isoprenylcysteine carboxylmethyltransferase family protein [Bacteroidales bacterium]
MASENLKGHHHGRHAGREDLTGEHRLGDTIQVIFIVVFIAVWILDSFVLGFSTSLAESIPWFIRLPVGAILLIFAFYLAQSGVRTVFGRTRESPQVITGGVFSVVRHPIYLGAILVYAGMTCLTVSLASAVLLVIIVVFYRYISRYEEKLLTHRFGDEYREYMKKVPMLFPIKIKRDQD